jgi:hypothetical protein
MTDDDKPREPIKLNISAGAPHKVEKNGGWSFHGVLERARRVRKWSDQTIQHLR